MACGGGVKGKVAIVTGAALGIGLSCCRELLRSGLKGLTACDFNSKIGECVVTKLNKEFGKDKAIFVKTDVTKRHEFEDAFKESMCKWEALDIVINNAGILKEGQWERVITTNITSLVRGSLLSIQHMGKNNGGKGGVVVNMASILGLQPFVGCPVYTGTKHFVIGFDRSLGDEYIYNLTGIKFLTMCPGVTHTPLIDSAGDTNLPGVKGLGKVVAKGLASLPPQSVDCVGTAMIKLISEGENGSIWVSEDSKFYEVCIPDRKSIIRK